MFPRRFNVYQESVDDNDQTTTETPEDEAVQEGMFDAGFSNLRSKIAQSLGGKFKVTNVVKGMGGKDKFDITEQDADIDSTKTTVESTGTGAKVVSRGNGKFKCHFTNIPLSQALNKILALFEKPELLLEDALFDIRRFGGSMFMEDAEEEIPANAKGSIPEEGDFDAYKSQGEEAIKKMDDKNDESKDDELSSFGTDTSDVQNDFNPKDIETLNKLIAAESEAINDYFDGAKDAHDENLRRLYGDIGHEERFHLEQLLYAKSTLTGEKYEPRDPEVKSEYEELVAMGMDEETAASTAIDKTSLNDSGDDGDIEKLEQEAAIVETMLFHNEILLGICEQFIPNGYNAAYSKSIGVFVEAYIQEEMENVSQAPKEVKRIGNPVRLLSKALKASVNGLIRLSGVVRDAAQKTKFKNHWKKEWIKKHGVADLFKGGIHLYFYSDKFDRFDLDTPCQYIDLMYRITVQIGKECGIKVNGPRNQRTIKNPIRFKTAQEGIDKLNGAVLAKTKVVVTDSNKDALAKEFFGYTDEKINVKTTRGDGPAINESGNIYNRIDVLAVVTKAYCDISQEVLDKLIAFEGDVNSIYYKNRKAYNAAIEKMKTIVNKYSQFIKCMAHDLSSILKLDNGLLELTRQRDKVEQTGGTWTGRDIRANTK